MGNSIKSIISFFYIVISKFIKKQGNLILKLSKGNKTNTLSKYKLFYSDNSNLKFETLQLHHILVIIIL